MVSRAPNTCIPGQARSSSWPTGEDATACASMKMRVALKVNMVAEFDAVS